MVGLDDTLITTGAWKNLVVEILVVIIMPYPSEYGNRYSED